MPRRPSSWGVALFALLVLGGLLLMHGLDGTSALLGGGVQHEHTVGDDGHDRGEHCPECHHAGHVAGVCAAVLVGAWALRRTRVRVHPTALPVGSRPRAALGSPIGHLPLGLPPPVLIGCVLRR